MTMKFSYARFRELFEKTENAVTVSRQVNSSEILSRMYTVTNPDNTILFAGDYEDLVWVAALIEYADVNEIVPFQMRRECLIQIIEEYLEEFRPRFVRKINEGFALHPAIYYAAGNATVFNECENPKFDFETFMFAIAEWLTINNEFV